MQPQFDTIAIIGVGRLGSALAQALYNHNHQIKVLVDPKLSFAQSIARIVKAKACIEALPLPEPVDVVFLCVPDDEIAPVAADLARLRPAEKLPRYAFHCSGALSSEVLAPLQQVGVHCASFHPIQTFSGKADDWHRLSNIFFGLEGDAEAVQKAIEILKSLRSDWLLIPKEKKVHYHAACCIASNYLASLLIPAIELFASFGLSESEILKLLKPLLETTLGNLTLQGIETALTGPISRGDVHTIQNHLNILEADFPQYGLFYKLHGQILLNLKSVADKIPPNKYQELRKLLNDQGLEHE